MSLCCLGGNQHLRRRALLKKLICKLNTNCYHTWHLHSLYFICRHYHSSKKIKKTLLDSAVLRRTSHFLPTTLCLYPCKILIRRPLGVALLPNNFLFEVTEQLPQFLGVKKQRQWGEFTSSTALEELEYEDTTASATCRLLARCPVPLFHSPRHPWPLVTPQIQNCVSKQSMLDVFVKGWTETNTVQKQQSGEYQG